MRKKKVSKEEMILLVDEASHLRAEGSRHTINPIMSSKENVNFLQKMKKETERQLALLNGAIGNIVGSEVYQKLYGGRKNGKRFFSTTST